MNRTKIEWADAVWNPVTGCTPVSQGCDNCYARRMAYRLRGRFGYPEDEPFRPTPHMDRLNEPLRWKKPRRVFVSSMGDIFHPDIELLMLALIFDIIKRCPQHTFMILTKRPEIALEHYHNTMLKPFFGMPNIWLGVTAENQQAADERIPILLQIPAAVRFVSVEPMLGPVDLSEWLKEVRYCERHGQLCEEGVRWENDQLVCKYCRKPVDRIHLLDWVIVGGETGPGARPMHPNWVRSLRDQAVDAGVPFFFKSWGMWIPSYDAGERCEETDQYGRSFGKCWSQTKTYYRFPDGLGMVLVGKKAAGRLLDGRGWDEMPSQVMAP